MINGNMIGIGSAPLKTVILEDENGSTLTGVVTGSEVVFTATDNDVREGMVYASDEGVSTGSKVIPSYHTSEGTTVIPNGSEYAIYIPNYDYTKLQAIICTYNSSLSNSVYSERVVINDNIYAVQSTESISAITIDNNNSAIKFGITNTSGNPIIIRYFTYKEIY